MHVIHMEWPSIQRGVQEPTQVCSWRNSGQLQRGNGGCLKNSCSWVMPPNDTYTNSSRVFYFQCFSIQSTPRQNPLFFSCKDGTSWREIEQVNGCAVLPFYDTRILNLRGVNSISILHYRYRTSSCLLDTSCNLIAVAGRRDNECS